MKKFNLKNVSDKFYEKPLKSTFIFSFIIAFPIAIVTFVITCTSNFEYLQYFDDVFIITIFYTVLAFVGLLTMENIIFLIIKPRLGNNAKAIRYMEVFGIILGIFATWSVCVSSEIVLKDWNISIYTIEYYTPIYTKSMLTIVTICIMALMGYVYLRFIPLCKQPPLMTVLGISAMYLGAIVCIIWCIQICTESDFSFLCLFPINFIIIVARTVRYLVYEKSQMIDNKCDNQKFRKLSALVNKSSNLPWIALLAAIPLLGILIAILALFGQQPDSIIKAWTETADWNLSQKIAPQRIPYDGHYLCTVAAGGHRKVVKPIRTGKRHGHCVVVNRQLCIANAFEQLIEERTPKFHKFIRNLYDKTGYPISKHINSPYVADIIYFLMKPLEWSFLFVLYLFDVSPENRIAIQYPHSKIPKIS